MFLQISILIPSPVKGVTNQPSWWVKEYPPALGCQWVFYKMSSRPEASNKPLVFSHFFRIAARFLI